MIPMRANILMGAMIVLMVLPMPALADSFGVGEMETLVNKSESFVPGVESQYEAEISKIETEIMSLDVVSRFVSADYNLTQRLGANIKALEAAAKLAKTSGGYFASAMERTYQCMKVAG